MTESSEEEAYHTPGRTHDTNHDKDDIMNVTSHSQDEKEERQSSGLKFQDRKYSNKWENIMTSCTLTNSYSL